jgi:hypothetical protein
LLISVAPIVPAGKLHEIVSNSAISKNYLKRRLIGKKEASAAQSK